MWFASVLMDKLGAFQLCQQMRPLNSTYLTGVQEPIAFFSKNRLPSLLGPA